MKKIFIIMLYLVFVGGTFVAAGADAPLEVTLTMKDTFRAGEKVDFQYQLRTRKNMKVHYEFWIECPAAPIPFAQEKFVQLKAGETLKDEFTVYEQLDPSLEPQTGEVVFKVYAPLKKTIRKKFALQLKPGFSCRLQVSNVQERKVKRKVVRADQAVYLDCHCSLQGVTLKGSLQKKGEKARQIDFPRELKLTPGRYRLRIAARKPGCKTVKHQHYFTVIDRPSPVKRLVVDKASLKP
jgi:hypothetical protein